MHSSETKTESTAQQKQKNKTIKTPPERQGMNKKKEIKLRVSEDLYNSLKANIPNQNLSLNRAIIELLKQQTTITAQPLLTAKQNKTIQNITEKRIRLTEDEAQILQQYAQANGWKLTQEIRYRVIGSLSKKGKISGEEMREMRENRNAINALGRNINRLIREGHIVDQEGKDACHNLVSHILKLNNPQL
ncbi:MULTISPECIES: hypothetical protein [unclassified Rickettsia]|uniref:hypothetical protein n=1 Tax=unclassified Rickettsia TaxID=114295 RepID=UPI0008310682|nr:MULTISPECIES: hypothetical protein [unclassified Rickettsia]ODA37114.1 hypothetical protein A8V34_00675 [Rickettsia sp. wq]ODA37195.1 hypothetical protein A8V33_00195 [Rickettsia sp. wb]